MSDGSWNPWKLTAIGMALVISTALVTGLVVAGWVGNASNTAAPGASGAPARAVAAVPSQADIDACNQQARAAAGDKTVEVVKDAAIGGAVGAGVGAAGGAIADGGKGAGKGAGIGALVGVAAGTLYGINQNKAHDARYAQAYRACMKARGYSA